LLAEREAPEKATAHESDNMTKATKVIKSVGLRARSQSLISLILKMLRPRQRRNSRKTASEPKLPMPKLAVSMRLSST